MSSADSPCRANASLAQVQEYLTRFESIPDMLELDHLTVSGDVTFGKNVSLKVSAHSLLNSWQIFEGRTLTLSG